MKRGIMLILSAPSGAGKTTIMHALLEHDPTLKRSISVTTRPKRPGEMDAVDYFFVTREKYEQLKAQDQLIEHAEVFGHGYGTLKTQAEDAINNGVDVVYTIDWQGMVQVKKKYSKDMVSIFIRPPSMKVLEQRLRNRNTDSDEVITKRLQGAKLEMSKRTLYDYVVVNDQIPKVVARIERILARRRIKC